MQTFLPVENFQESAKILDYKRLGKQRVECKQILLALQNKAKGIKSGWQNHPATLMWEGYEKLLCIYALAMCEEWIERGYKDSLWPFFNQQYGNYAIVKIPRWWGWEPLYSSHRARLLEKDPLHYGQFNWAEQPLGPDGYVWPINKDGSLHSLLATNTNGKISSFAGGK